MGRRPKPTLLLYPGPKNYFFSYHILAHHLRFTGDPLEPKKPNSDPLSDGSGASIVFYVCYATGISTGLGAFLTDV